MENASKALLIAAGILIGLILITMIIYGYDQISNYYNTKEQVKVLEQLSDFNEQYEPYNRDDVRGSDILSLINKIIDYNTINEGEEKIEISITIPDDDTAKLFYYNYNKNKDVVLIQLKQQYTQNNIKPILTEANRIENKYTPGIVTKLSANISTLMGENRLKTKKNLLIELKLMKKEDTQNPDNVVNNQEILKYYQYQQFKRAHFDCTELTYTTQGRVKKFSFKFNGTFE